MRNLQRTVLPLAAMLIIGLSSAANAQGGRPGGGGPGGGGFQMSPEVQKKFQAWRKWNEAHPNFRTLGQSVRAISDMDKDAKTKITKDQAKKMWAAVGPWTSKPTMSDADAKALNNKIVGALNTTQIKKMAAIQSEQRQRFGGGPGGGGGGRPGGGGPGGGGGGGGFGGGGGRPGGGGPGGGARFDPSKMPNPKDYNPLNVGSYPDTPMTQRGKQRMTDFIKLLKARAA